MRWSAPCSSFQHIIGGCWSGLLAGRDEVVYLGLGKNPDVTTSGLFYGHPKQLLIQLEAAVTVILWDALVTYVILRVIKFFTPLRYEDAILVTGDMAIHGEVAYPEEEPELVGALVGDGTSDGQGRHDVTFADKPSEVVSD